MTASQLKCIQELRQLNYSYQFIADQLSLSINTVKSICRRKGFPAEGQRKTKSEKSTANLCKNCHRPLSVRVRKGTEFCSEACRIAWWASNRKVVEKQP